MTLQLLACLACVQLLAACNSQSPARSIRESLFFLHTLEHFFTLSHSLPLQESHLITRLLIVEIQANLARNKANKMVDKIQPYSSEINLIRSSHPPQRKKEIKRERRINAISNEFILFFNNGNMITRRKLQNHKTILAHMAIP